MELIWLTIQFWKCSINYQQHVYYYLGHEKRIIPQSLIELNKAMLDSLNAYLDFLISIKNPKAKAFENGIELIKKRGGLSLDK